MLCSAGCAATKGVLWPRRRRKEGAASLPLLVYAHIACPVHTACCA